MQTYYDHLTAQLSALSTTLPHPIDPSLLVYSSDLSRADLSYPCFQLAKDRGMAPPQIATTIAAALQPDAIIGTVTTAGPYVNITINDHALLSDTIATIAQQGDTYGTSAVASDTILVESPSPNTNKPLHLGHVRNMLLGNALDNILRAVGNTVHKVEVINDRGIHICKSMLAYQRLGNNAQPDKKSDHYVGDRYVRFATEAAADPSRNDAAQQMLIDREAGDPATRDLRQRMNTRAIEGMRETYARYHARIDNAYLESDTYTDGKAIIEQGLTDGVFVRDKKNNIAFAMTDKHDETSHFVVLRADGTGVYATQDIGMIYRRMQDYELDQMIYVVANEQSLYFSSLFEIFAALGVPCADKCHHLNYGMVYLPSGKMKSREGNVVDADSLADEMHDAALTLVRDRYADLTEEEYHHRAETIGMAAITYFILNYDYKKDFTFRPDESLAFDGQSGPYILYTYARCRSILTKAADAGHRESDAEILSHLKQTTLSTDDLDPKERILLAQLTLLPRAIQLAAADHKTHLITQYLYDVATAANSMYHACPILDSADEIRTRRLYLIDTTATVLRNACALLHIDVLEKM